MDGESLSLAYPTLLLMILLLIPLVWQGVKGRTVRVRFSSLKPLTRVGAGSARLTRHLFWVLRVALLLLLIIAAARPQWGKSERERTSEGLDMVLVVDTSGSMRALDLTLNGNRYDRLTVVKNVLLDFIKKRPSDRIGMVVFGTEAFTQAPLTLDHEVLVEFLGKLEIEMAGPQTAIGDGLATAVKRLQEVEAKSKVVILLTDGENSAGAVDPLEAARAASTLGIKVYTIGVGKNGQAPMPVQGFFGMTTQMVQVSIDEALLQEMASLTGGRAFLARNTEELQEIYATIDELEKTEVEILEYVDYEEAGAPFVLWALILLGVETLLGLTRFRSIP